MWIKWIELSSQWARKGTINVKETEERNQYCWNRSGNKWTAKQKKPVDLTNREVLLEE